MEYFFRNNLNVNQWEVEDSREFNTMPSMTQQGMSSSVKDIVQKFQNGIPINYIQGEYSESEEPMPIIRDFTDIDEYKKDVEEARKRQEARKEKHEKEKQEKEKEPISQPPDIQILAKSMEELQKRQKEFEKYQTKKDE